MATVPFTTAIAGSFVANLTGCADGVQYSIGVRSFNLISEEQNTVMVSVIADATGPEAVSELTAERHSDQSPQKEKVDCCSRGFWHRPFPRLEAEIFARVSGVTLCPILAAEILDRVSGVTVRAL